MAYQDSGTIRPPSTDPFRFTPYWAADNVEPAAISTRKGSEIMEGLLLDQYTNKPILAAYFQAFIDEMDTLFNQVDSVYFGRFLDRAVGVQLDVIGRILNQGRQVALPQVFFGFDGALNADQMADEASPADGGWFQSGQDEGFDSQPLNDVVYRRLLRAKALSHNRHERSYDFIYKACILLLDRVPRKLKLESVASRTLDLIVSREDVSAYDVTLLLYFAQYMTPLGTSLAITREAP